jgi:hypothetical protein
MPDIANTKNFVLGSGMLYIAEYAGTVPENATLEVDTNKIGTIKGGATLAYKPEFYEVSDDLGTVKEEILTSEKVSLKSGIMVPNMKFLQKAAPTVKVTEGTATPTATPTVTKIGGIKNANGKKYVVRFVHVSAADPNYALRVTIIGNNTSGFDLGMVKDKETIVDLEFAATPMDSTGTLVQFDEPVKAS